MDNDNNIFLLKLLKYKIKPNLSHYTFDQLTNIYIELNDKKDNWLDKIQNILPENTLNIVKNIFNDIKIINLNRKTETENKKILINWIDDLWTKLPLLDDTNNIVECVICLNYINNNDFMIFKCNHITHTTCFLNYLFSNLKNNSHIDADVEKLFRCPNCRIFLTDMVKKSFGQNELGNEYEADNEYVLENNYYGDEYNNLILQEYNLVANMLDNHTLNNVFRMSNNIGFGSNAIIYHNDRNITQLSSSLSLSSSSSLSSLSSLSNFDYSINSDEK